MGFGRSEAGVASSEILVSMFFSAHFGSSEGWGAWETIVRGGNVFLSFFASKIIVRGGTDGHGTRQFFFYLIL